MVKKMTYNEQQLLKSAEEEFLEKGYTNTKTTEIAKRAGVTHAMLHYYYRTKENLFEVVLANKLEELSGTFFLTIKQDLPFLEKIKKSVEDHFDFIALNPRFPTFIFTEILANKDAQAQLFRLIKPKAQNLVRLIKKEMQEEVSKGRIRYMDPFNLIYSIISLNVFAFMALPIFTSVYELSEMQIKEFIEHRKKQNVAIILQQLKIE